MENVKGEATIDFEQQTVLIYITKLSPLLNKEVREHIPVNFNKQMCKKNQNLFILSHRRIGNPLSSRRRSETTVSQYFQPRKFIGLGSLYG